jgi:hypothetical protein
MKQKYEKEQWFNEKFYHDHMSVKDSLKLLLNASLEKYLVSLNYITGLILFCYKFFGFLTS